MVIETGQMDVTPVRILNVDIRICFQPSLTYLKVLVEVFLHIIAAFAATVCVKRNASMV